MRKYKLNTLLEIEWLDIVDDSSWQDDDKAGTQDAAKCRTVGYYLNHDKRVVRLSSTVSEGQRSVITIPVGCIESVVKIRKAIK